MKTIKNNGVKIAVIGGGSSYTPELMDGFIKRHKELPIREIVLVDIEEGKEKLKIVAEMSQRMWDSSPCQTEVRSTLHREEALLNADFVITQLRVGQLDARIKDERIPQSHGLLGQETNGAGGIFKALRTIPVILNLIVDMKKLCPNAWLINFTNPSGMITEAILRYGNWEKVIGLCNVPISAMVKESRILGHTPDELNYLFGGLNHFHWHRVYDKNGQEVTDKMIDNIYNKEFGIVKNIHDVPFFMEHLKAIGMIPCPYHRYYYRQEEMLQFATEDYETIGTRAEQVKQTETELFELYQDVNLTEKPEQLSKRGGAHYSDAACEAITSLYRDKKTYMVVSTKNKGALPDLPPDCAVEVSSYISASGPLPIAFGALSPAERGWLQLMKNMELCVCEAAISGDYGMLMQAFALNPLIPFGERAREVIDELLIAHKKYLPQFSATISALENRK